MNSELEWFHNFFKNENPEKYKKYIDSENEVSEHNKIEYGRDLSLNEMLDGTDADCIELILCGDFNGLIPIKLIENEISVFIEIHRMIDDVDFVILVKDRVLNTHPEAKFNLIAEEAFHIVEHIEKNYHDHKFVVKMASDIVGEFIQSQIEKISKL